MNKRTEENFLNRDPILKQIVDTLVEAFKPERIYLFGSKARGQDGPDSDYDIMVVVPDDTPKEKKQLGQAPKVLWENGVTTAADVLVWTKGRFDSRLHLKASLPATIVDEGKLLYAA